LKKKLTSLSNFTSNSLSAQLAFIVSLSGLIYAGVFTLRFPLPRLYTTIPPVDYTKLTNYSIGGLVVYGVGIGVLFWLYLWAFRLTRPGRAGSDSPSVVGGRFIFISSAVLALASILSYPLTAIDLFIYALRTRGWALHDLNPLRTAPEQLPTTDPWLGLVGEWGGAPSPYGPVWEWLSLGAYYLGRGDFLNHLLLLKIVAALAYLGCVWLVYSVLRRLRPEWAVAGTVAFAWNPLVLLESIQNGHNDILMTFFLLAAVWGLVNIFTFNGRKRTGLFLWLFLLINLFLALSILVKFVTVIVAPFFLIALAATRRSWPGRLGIVSLSGLSIAALVGVTMWPLWPGWEDWAVLQAGRQAGRSLLALLILSFKGSVGVNTAFDLARALILLLFAAIYLYFLWQMLSSFVSLSLSPVTLRLAISASYFVLFWYVLLAAPVFHAWYLLWFLPLAAVLLPRQRPLSSGIVFSITALLIIPYFETIRVWYPALLENQLWGHLVGVPLLIGPPALALLWPIGPSIDSEV
jgi:hypothetical protein